MALFNETDIFGILIVNFTNNVTGDIFLSLFMIMFLIFMFFVALRIPIELTAVIMLPLLITFMAYAGGNWLPVAGIFLLYLAILFARFFFK